MFKALGGHPISLLSSDQSSEDEIMAPTRKRFSYIELVNSGSLTSQHFLTLINVCLITFIQSLQMYLPLLLTKDLETADISLLLISYPLASFLAPLLNALLIRIPLHKRMCALLTTSLFCLLISVATIEKFHTTVTMHCLAGVLVIPKSVLTQLWSHVFPESWQRTCRLLTLFTQAAALSVALVLLAGNYMQDNAAYAIICTLILTLVTYVTSAILSLWIIDTPLMQLNNGKYSCIMDSVRKYFEGPTISSLRLQEIDFSDDSATGLWNPTYLYNEHQNNKNLCVLGVQMFISGFITIVLSCSAVVDCKNIYCLMRDEEKKVHLQYVWVGISSLLNVNFLPIDIRYQLSVSSMIGIIALCFLSVKQFSSQISSIVIFCLAMVSYISLNSTISHIISTVSLSIAGECIIGVIFSGGLTIGKLTVDAGLQYAIITCTVLMGSAFLSGFFINLPRCKNAISNRKMLVEMDDPITETFEMKDNISCTDEERESDYN